MRRSSRVFALNAAVRGRAVGWHHPDLTHELELVDDHEVLPSRTTKRSMPSRSSGFPVGMSRCHAAPSSDAPLGEHVVTILGKPDDLDVEVRHCSERGFEISADFLWADARRVAEALAGRRSRSGGRRAGVKDFCVLQEMLRLWSATLWTRRSMLVGTL
jgi:hypothetical protein